MTIVILGYESVNMRDTYPTQSFFLYYFNTLCIFDMIGYRPSSVVSCLRYTIINFLDICVSLRDYVIVIIITHAKKLTISR